MADDTLTLSIVADTGTTQDDLDAVTAKIAAMEAELAELRAGGAAMGTTLTEAHTAAGGAATKHAEAETILGAAVGKAETATNSMARALGGLGINAGEASERVLALTEALDAVGAASGPLLALGAAALVIGGSFNFLVDGIKDAARESASLSQIGNALQAQGADWGEAKEQVEKFTDALREQSTFSGGEILDSLQQLITRGLSLAEAEEATTAAAKLASAENLSLRDATDLLTSAEGARVKQLEKYDPALKAIIDRHGSLHEIVVQVSKDFDGALSASLDNVDGKGKNLANEWGNLSKDVGAFVEGPLGALIDGLDSAVKWLDQTINAVGDFMDLLGHSHFTTDSMGNVVVAKPQKDGPSVGGFGDEAGDDMFQRYAHANHDDPWNAPTGILPKEKREKKGGEPFDFQDPPALNIGKDADDDKVKTLDNLLKTLTSDLGVYDRAVADATTTQAQHAAELAKDAAVVNTAKEAIAAIALVLDSEQNKLAALNAELSKQQTAAENAHNAYVAYGHAIGSSPTEAEKEHLKDLKTAMDNAATAYHATQSEVDKLNGLIDTNNAKLTENVAKLNTLTAAQAANTRENVAAMKAAIASLDASDATIDKLNEERAAQVENLQTENALYGKSLEQQLDFYRKRDALEISEGQKGSDQEKADFEKTISISGQMYQERIEQQKAFIESAQSLESSFLDTVLTKHQSLKDSLHEIFGDIESDFVKMLEQMLLKSQMLNGINSTLEKIFNVGGAGGTAGGIAGGSGLGSILGGVGSGAGSIATSSLITGVDTPGSNSVVDLGSNTILAQTGSPTGITPAQASAGFGTADISNGAGGGDDFATAGPSAGTYLGGALMGAGVGGTIAGITGGNETYGSVGGALGSSLGTFIGTLGGATGGPLGSIIGTLLGSVVGGLFGSKATPATSPDIFDTTNYGQGVANLTGQMAGANGQYFYSNVEQQTGGLGEIGYIEEALAGATKITSGSQAGWYTTASGQQLNPQQYQQLVNAFGISATGSGQLNFGHNIGQQWITGAAGASSSPESYTQLDALAASFLSSSGGAAASIPVFTVSRSMPDMNLGKLNADGTYTQSNNATTVSTTPATTTSSATKSAVQAIADAMNGTPETRTLGGQPIELHIHLDGAKFLTASDIQKTTDMLAQSMSKSLQRFTSGTIAGGIAARSSRNGNI